MDLTESIAPRSDQLNAEDLLVGPRTFTIEKVAAGNEEQPVWVHLVELPGRPYKPSKSMRRLMVAAWGAEASAYTGRRLTLYRNPEITFGREKVGGIEISNLSHLDKPLTVALTVTRGRRKNFTVQPLTEPAPAPARDWVTEARQFTTVDDLRAHYKAAQAGGATAKQLADIYALANNISTPEGEQ